MNIEISDIREHIYRDNWDITEKEIELDDKSNKMPISYIKTFMPSIYEEMKNFYLAVIRMDTIREINEIIKYYILQQKTLLFMTIYRNTFARYVAYAIPSKKAIKQVVKWFWDYKKLNKNTKLVDFGCGSGIWCLLLNNAGIPKDSLIGVDLPDENKNLHNFGRKYYDIIYDNNYQVDKNDIFFIAWGYIDEKIIDDYVSRGGKCIIILGEDRGGCTHPSGDYFINKNNLKVKITKVIAGVSTITPDILSLNIRQ